MSSDLTPRLAPLDPGHPEALALMALSEALMSALYPSESNHFEPPDGLRPPHGAFWGCRLGEQLVGCGGVKLQGGYGEIKRLFVLESARGRGIARRLMGQLEADLVGLGIGLARLETGIHQPEALALYRQLGYRECGPFGSYAADPLSAFFEKPLPAPAA